MHSGPGGDAPVPGATSSRLRALTPLGVSALVSAPLLAALFELAEDLPAFGGTARVDAWAVAFALSVRTPAATSIFYGLTVLANTGVVVALTTATTVYLLVRRRFAEAVLVVVTVGGGQLIGTLLKLVVARSRPPLSGALIGLPPSYAFPSGHALAAVLLYGVVAFLLVRAERLAWQRAVTAALAALLAVAIGASRVYLGVHWPTDVLGSWLLGGAWLSLCIGAYLSWERWRGAAAEPAEPGPIPV
jgi:undecaprenyl-diphosphatase